MLAVSVALALLASQDAGPTPDTRLRLPQPGLVAGLEPGTRLLPFGEDEPSRGPLAPPQPPAPPPPTEDEWRALRLLRAKGAADVDSFGHGPKDVNRATALSAEGTLAGIVFPPLLTVGPAAGEAYAGDWTHALVTSAIRTVLLAGIVATVVSFSSALSTPGAQAAQLAQAANVMDLALAAGGTGIAITAAFDILTAPDSAERANRRWEHEALGEPP